MPEAELPKGTKEIPARSQECRSLLFTDIKESVGLFQKLGNDWARSYTCEHDRLLREQIESNGGRLVDQAGDSLFGAFPDPARAVRAAFAMQEAIRLWWLRVSPGFPFGIRIGLHQGPVIIEGERLAGDAVNLASRTMGQADAHEIVISEAIRAGLPKDVASRFDYFGPFHPKGAKGVIEIHRWRAPWKQGPGECRFDEPLKTTQSSDLDESGWRFDPRGDAYELVGLSPEIDGVRFRIDGEFRSLGRSTDCDCRLDPSRVGSSVSRVHMGLVVARRQGWVFDLGGSGGVLLSSSADTPPLRVVQRAPIPVGTHLRTGSLRWRVDLPASG